MGMNIEGNEDGGDRGRREVKERKGIGWKAVEISISKTNQLLR